MIKGIEKVCASVVAIGIMLSNNMAYANTVNGNSEISKSTIGQKAPSGTYCVSYTEVKVYAKSPITAGRYTLVDSYTENESYQRISGNPTLVPHRTLVSSTKSGNYRHDTYKVVYSW